MYHNSRDLHVARTLREQAQDDAAKRDRRIRDFVAFCHNSTDPEVRNEARKLERDLTTG